MHALAGAGFSYSISHTRSATANLRHLLLGGEAVPSELVNELQTLTSAQIHNMYGPTETTIWSTTYTGDCGPQTMPIGKPTGKPASLCAR